MNHQFNEMREEMSTLKSKMDIIENQSKHDPEEKQDQAIDFHKIDEHEDEHLSSKEDN